MDFGIEALDGNPVMVMDRANGLFNNLVLSLTLPKGSWWFNPEFGHRFDELKKLTPQSERLAEEFAREALRWLIDTGRALSVEVSAERDRQQNPNRLLLRVRVTAARGELVEWQTFVEVG